jgi:hypothetical protein
MCPGLIGAEIYKWNTCSKMARSAKDTKTNTLLLKDFAGGAAFSFRILFGFFSPSTSTAAFLIFFALSSSLHALASMPLESS